jgi:glycosyltransferase involved in cell wall biosynthesis
VAEAEAWCDVMVLQGYATTQHPALARSPKIVVFDIYDPLHLETLAFTVGITPEVRSDRVELAVATLNYQLQRGDFLICASERQRDFYLGQLAALGRLNTITFDDDPTLRRLIDVVPFGLPECDPQHTRPVLKGVVPGIEVGDEVIVWAGGVYNWLDPVTLVQAVGGLSRTRPRIRLYFMGLRHPNPSVPNMWAARKAKEVATDLSLLNKHVFFNEGWVDYVDRQNYLLEADVGVVCHYANVETRFAFRTRVLDYLWSGLPIVSTEGDYFADVIDREGLGLTVPAEDPVALEDALARVLGDPAEAEKYRARVRVVREQFRWTRAIEPLTQFCRNPRHAPDFDTSGLVISGTRLTSGMTIAKALRLCRHYYREGGPLEVARRIVDRARRKARERL